MIKSVDEYEYVVGEDVDAAHPHGDLDRIIIDGEIMPFRTGDTSNVDATGNPIPRANILRGEDIAFLMEAVTQRAGKNWLAESYSYQWVYDSSSGTWSKKKRTAAGTTVKKMVFSRKVRAVNFGGRHLPNAKNGIIDHIDGICDNCMGGLSVGTKVFDVNSDVERPSSDDFHKAYDFSGLPNTLRPYKKYDTPKSGRALDQELLYAYFMTVATLKYAYLGTVGDATPRYSVNVDGDTGGYPTDFTIVETEEDGVPRNEYMTWGVAERKWREWDKDTQEYKSYEGAAYCAVKSDFVFSEFKARHVRNASAVAVLSIYWYKEEGDNYSSDQKEVWLPVSLTGGGSGVFRLASAGNFDTKQSVISILSKGGWTKSKFSSDEKTEGKAHASIYLDVVHILGEWDDHTSIGA